MQNCREGEKRIPTRCIHREYLGYTHGTVPYAAINQLINAQTAHTYVDHSWHTWSPQIILSSSSLPSCSEHQWMLVAWSWEWQTWVEVLGQMKLATRLLNLLKHHSDTGLPEWKIYSLNILSKPKHNKLAWDTFDDRVLVVVDMIYWLTMTDCQSGLRYISLLCEYLEC